MSARPINLAGAVITLGIDVGLTGAIAAIDEYEQLVALHDLPVMVHGSAKWIDGSVLLSLLCDIRGGKPARAIVEHVHAMPKLGTVAANSKGMTMGSVLATLQMASCAIELVSPQTWKRDLGLIAPKSSDREKKAASLSKARMLFPTADLDRVKDHNRAEALLLASWAMRRLARNAA